MINKIKYKKELEPFITDACEENKIFVSMAGDIPPNNYLVIKVDKYYNSLKLSHTPSSVDCLILLKCFDNDFVIYLIELKNIKSPKGFKVDNIFSKFETTIKNFMSKRFKDIFLNKRYTIKDLHLFFVTNPYRKSEKFRRKESTRMDFLLSIKPFRFRGKKYQLEHKLPSPMIRNC